jgi:hypothetical protein
MRANGNPTEVQGPAPLEPLETQFVAFHATAANLLEALFLSLLDGASKGIL